MSHPSSEELLDLSLGFSESAEIRSHLNSCPNCARSYAALAEEEETLHMYYAGLSHPQPLVRTKVFWKEILPMSIAAALLVGILTWIAVPHRTQEAQPIPITAPASPETAEELYRRFEKKFSESKSVSMYVRGWVIFPGGKEEKYSGFYKAKPGGRIAYQLKTGAMTFGISADRITKIGEKTVDYLVGPVTGIGFLASGYPFLVDGKEDEFEVPYKLFPKISTLRFAEGGDADHPILEYEAVLGKSRTLSVRLLLDRKTLMPWERVATIPHEMGFITVRELYDGPSTDELPDSEFASGTSEGPKPITTPEVEKKGEGRFPIPDQIWTLLDQDLESRGFSLEERQTLAQPRLSSEILLLLSTEETTEGVRYFAPDLVLAGTTELNERYFAGLSSIQILPIERGFQMKGRLEVKIVLPGRSSCEYEIAIEGSAIVRAKGTSDPTIFRAEFTGPKRVK